MRWLRVRDPSGMEGRRMMEVPDAECWKGSEYGDGALPMSTALFRSHPQL